MIKKTIQSVEVDASGPNIRVFANIEDEEGTASKSELPQRELSALLPRYILLGDTLSIDNEVLPIIEETLTKLLTGRCVREWKYEENQYFGFPSWRSVKTRDLHKETIAPGVG